MSAEHAPKVPTYTECARTDKSALVAPESVSKDDERAPAIHCTNIAVAGGVKYSMWFGGSYEGSTDTKIYNDDGGETWSIPRELVPGPDGKRNGGPQKNPPIVLSNGDCLAAGSYEVTNPPGSEAYGWIRSDPVELPSDRGKADRSFPGEGKPGHCYMTMRSSVGCIIQADSTNYGRTWGPACRTSLPTNNSGHCVTTSRNGRVIYEDDGKTWKLGATLEDAPLHDDLSEYPCLTPTEEDAEDGVWVSWIWQRREIMIARVVEGR
ncbi:glycoside hydrolase family 33 protein [Karstenula rhodostoma CBS 690.94]|uniref:Glycoside hydrolase family 33 protein n=1 Tax=Karstenula rhodostoma CBS 690.94 TaxID=1392251 RepID=A0A9P4UEQ6_9PLEO|nr:glycoside hydrolase family 33 protein [Karstenula rhodostoma CBS 690.94]